MTVVDASVAIKWFVREDGRPQAMRLLEEGNELSAPDFIRIEVANIGWKKIRLGQADTDQISGMISRLDGFFASLEQSARLLPQALRIATALDHPIYDCLYLACAEERGESLVTADARLANKRRSSGQRDVVLLHEWAPAHRS